MSFNVLRSSPDLHPLKTCISTSLLYGISASNILKLQRCQNAAARLLLQQSSTPSVHDIMDRLHWLPIRARIDFKIATLTYNTLTIGHPAHLRELISPYQPSRLLRSGKQLLLTVPRAKLAIGQRAFSYSSPVIWNAIPLSVRDAPSISTFKRRLKSFYFNSLLSKS